MFAAIKKRIKKNKKVKLNYEEDAEMSEVHTQWSTKWSKGSSRNSGANFWRTDWSGGDDFNPC